MNMVSSCVYPPAIILPCSSIVTDRYSECFAMPPSILGVVSCSHWKRVAFRFVTKNVAAAMQTTN